MNVQYQSEGNFEVVYVAYHAGEHWALPLFNHRPVTDGIRRRSCVYIAVYSFYVFLGRSRNRLFPQVVPQLHSSENPLSLTSRDMIALHFISATDGITYAFDLFEIPAWYWYFICPNGTRAWCASLVFRFLRVLFTKYYFMDLLKIVLKHICLLLVPGFLNKKYEKCWKRVTVGDFHPSLTRISRQMLQKVVNLAGCSRIYCKIWDVIDDLQLPIAESSGIDEKGNVDIDQSADTQCSILGAWNMLWTDKKKHNINQLPVWARNSACMRIYVCMNVTECMK